MNNTDEALMMLNDGIVIEDIAAELGIEPSDVYKLLARTDVLKHLRERRNTSIIRAYTQRTPLWRIARVHHVSVGTIYNVVHAAGVAVQRERVTGSEERDADIVNDYTTGRKVSDVSRRNACSISYMYSVLERYGVQRRRVRR